MVRSQELSVGELAVVSLNAGVMDGIALAGALGFDDGPAKPARLRRHSCSSQGDSCTSRASQDETIARRKTRWSTQGRSHPKLLTVPKPEGGASYGLAKTMRLGPQTQAPQARQVR